MAINNKTGLVTPETTVITTVESQTVGCDTVVFPPANDLAWRNSADAALHWYRFGFTVIPIVPRNKQPAVKWDPWLAALSPEAIISHWSQNEAHEMGFVVGNDTIVFDADSAASVAALTAIEMRFGVQPNLIIKTSKGVHHHYKRGKGSHARSDSHSTKDYPERIDVKTGRAIVVLPPSTGKTIALCGAANATELNEASQHFIDAVFKHNGREPVRPVAIPPASVEHSEPTHPNLAELHALLRHFDANCGYEDWRNVLMAIFHETSGSADGLDLADAWSSKGRKYPGRREIEAKWRSFKPGHPNPVTIRTIYKLLSDRGIDVMAVCAAAESPFEPCETEIVIPGAIAANDRANPLDRYSLVGKSGEIEKRAVAEVPVLGKISLQGQLTVFYAAPNTGKTLITLALLIEAIQQGRVDPSKVYYLNMDDNSTGLLVKVRIGEEFKFHLLAEGYSNFSADQFHSHITEMIENDCANGVIVVLDTLKKFVDLMDKKKCSNFTRVSRGFALKGGTVIALAHTNKNPGRNGKPQYGGVGDIINDFDCAYIMTLHATTVGNRERVVEFENIKRRGDVIEHVAYSYCAEPGTRYVETLLSVQPYDLEKLEPLRYAQQLRSDAEIIDAIATSIKSGVNTKMRLASAVAQHTGASKRSALQVIEKYAGNDPAIHRWTYSIREHGAQVFEILEAPPPAPPQKSLHL